MEPPENCFERLSDDLLTYILEKLLWNPHARWGQKGRDRLWLESVCRRFQVLVRASRCLDWNFVGVRDEAVFLSYIFRHKSCASRVALDVRPLLNLTAILQSVLFPLDTLEEFHLFVEEGHRIDWSYVFLLLAALKGLRTLNIYLWGREPRLQNLEVLGVGWCPKPFVSLTSLTLYGFAITGPTFNASFKHLPALRDLEISEFTGQVDDLKVCTLEKVFVWSNQGVGIDLHSPARVGLPKSVGKVVALLNDLRPAFKETAARILLGLSNSAGNQKAIAHVPGCLHKLVNLLGGVGVARMTASRILYELSNEPSNQVLIAQTPGCLQQLLSILEGPNLQEHDTAARTLLSLAGKDRSGRHIVKEPGVLERLVGLLDSEIGDVGGWSFSVLYHLLSNAEHVNPIARVAGCLQKLGTLLEHSRFCLYSAKLVHILCKDGVARKSLVAMPGFLQKLVRLLASEKVDMQLWSVYILETLSQDFQSRKALLEIPQCWNMLVQLIKQGERTGPQLAARVLWDLAACEAYLLIASKYSRRIPLRPDSNREQVQQFCKEELVPKPGAHAQHRLQGNDASQAVAGSSGATARPSGCLKGLIDLWRHGSEGVRRSLLKGLWRTLQSGYETSNAVMRHVALHMSGIMSSLMDLLSDTEPLSGRAEALAVVSQLALTGKGRATMSDLAGCVERLVEILEGKEGKLAGLAGGVLVQFAADPSQHKFFQRLPGAEQIMVEVLDVCGPHITKRRLELHNGALAKMHQHLPSLLSVDALYRHLEGLVNYLVAGEEPAHGSPATLLRSCLSDSKARAVVWTGPSIVTNLVSLLGGGRTHAQQETSAELVGILASDRGRRRCIAVSPGCLYNLCALLSSGSRGTVEQAVRLLWKLTDDERLGRLSLRCRGLCRGSLAISKRTAAPWRVMRGCS